MSDTKFANEDDKNLKESLKEIFPHRSVMYRSVVVGITLILRSLQSNCAINCAMKWESKPVKLCTRTTMSVFCWIIKLHRLHRLAKKLLFSMKWSWCAVFQFLSVNSSSQISQLVLLACLTSSS